MFLSLITRLQVDGEDNNASRHLRNDSPVYAEMQRGLAPYTDLLGSTTRKLQRDVQQVKQAIEWLAPQHAHPMRRKQLVQGILNDKEFQEATHTDALTAIGEGIVHRLTEMRAQNLHKTMHGRIIYNGIEGAALSRISDDKPRTYGFIERVANTLGVGRRTIYYAKKKASEVVEDPTRAIRSDALDMGKIRQAWDALTQPEPNKGMKIMVRCGDGEYAPHVVHWQTEKTRVLYDKATQLFGRLCGVVKWAEGKPEYVKKPGHKTCLCPYCFKMKLLMVAFVRQVRLQAKPNNKCECPCCTHWRTQVVRGIAVPSHVRDLLDILLCEREVAPRASGYVGVYPFFKPSCCIPWMTHKDKAFCERELGPVEPCKICGTVPLFAGSDCTFTTEDAEVMYQRYVTVPRKVNDDKNVEEDKPTKKTTRDVIEWHRVQRSEFKDIFLEAFAKIIKHLNVVDNQDCFNRCLTAFSCPGHATLKADFGMSWEVTATAAFAVGVVAAVASTAAVVAATVATVAAAAIAVAVVVCYT